MRVGFAPEQRVVAVAFSEDFVPDGAFLFEDAHDRRNRIIGRFRFGHPFEDVVYESVFFVPQDLHYFEFRPGQFPHVFPLRLFFHNIPVDLKTNI